MSRTVEFATRFYNGERYENGKMLAEAYAKPLKTAKQATDIAKSTLGTVSSQITNSQSGIQDSVDALKNTAAGSLEIANSALGSIGGIKSQYADALGAAAGMTGDIASVRRSADSIFGMIPEYERYADIFNARSGEMFGQGSQMVRAGLDSVNSGNALINMDPSAGGLVGEYLKMYSSMSPDRFVSQAASDTQAAGQNAKDQASRDLSRRGVSASSGAYGALQKQFATLMATASAAAKTRARQMGLDAQASYLDRMTGAANSLVGTGSQMYAAGLQGQTAANAAQAQAMEASNQKAGALAQAGTLSANAAQLGATQSNAYASAYNGMNSSIVGMYGVANSANSTAVSAYNAAANAYSSMGSLLSALNSATSNVVTANNAQAGVELDVAKQAQTLNSHPVFHNQAMGLMDGLAKQNALDQLFA